MSTKQIFLLLAGILLLTVSFITSACKNPKLAGTSWRLHYEMLAMDDGPNIKCDQKLNFIDDTKVELTDITERSGYSASYMNEDGTVNYTPGSTSEEKKTGIYVVKDDVVEITFGEETTKYYLHGQYLLEDTTPEEYKKMEKYEREMVAFKKM